MDAKQTALVLIEYQNDFVKEGGAQHAAVKDVMASTGMLENSLDLVARARARGVSIMLAPISFAEGYPEVAAEPYGILAGVVGSNAFRKGSWGAQIIDELQPQAADIVIEGKRGLDCFASTNLDFILRARGVVNVALAGFLTNCCVESTMRSAYERGFNVVTMTDCTATLSDEEQRVATTKTYPMFSRPMTHQQFLAALDS
jgi:nicotinamidase-related amidase